jgi:hypothetical protein
MARFITCVTSNGKKVVKIYEADKYSEIMNCLFDDNISKFSINYIRNMDDDEEIFRPEELIQENE